MNDWLKAGLVVGGTVVVGVGIAYACRRRERSLGEVPEGRAPMKFGKVTCPHCSGLIVCEPERGVCGPAEIYVKLLPAIRRAKQESFWVTVLDSRNRVVATKEVHRGTVSTVLAHPRDVFREAISRNASAVIITHNHPSGSAAPSEDDVRLTERMIHAGTMIGIPVMDHLVIGREGTYASMRAERPDLFGTQAAQRAAAEARESGR